ncbi:MAG TPA: sugar ABC transporter permease, partial [Vicinamibacterales bacterium]|nr:sugar ABC transporter permease [Vicinamibacterales bacterium]
FWSALGHTAAFVAVSVTLEMAAGLLLALALHHLSRGGGIARTAVLLPWAMPTVVAALVWRFMFDSPAGLVSTVVARSGLTPPTWLADPIAGWLPIVLADAWKTTPFVAVLLLAGLQQIDSRVYEAADVDGAGPWRQLVDITLPLLRPVLLIACLFRTLDAFRVFDVVYVMTGGGPGTATEPIALYTFTTLMQYLRFGFGSALSIIVFAVAFVFALGVIRLLGPDTIFERSA